MSINLSIYIIALKEKVAYKIGLLERNIFENRKKKIIAKKRKFNKTLKLIIMT